MAAKTVSAGVIITDGKSILLAHPTQSKHWDIPKGKVELNESNILAAIRELKEETGIEVSQEDLIELGHFQYKKQKDLFLYLNKIEHFPKLSTLKCQAVVELKNGKKIPEMDRFTIVAWKDLKDYVVNDMLNVLNKIHVDHLNKV